MKINPIVIMNALDILEQGYCFDQEASDLHEAIILKREDGDFYEIDPISGKRTHNPDYDKELSPEERGIVDSIKKKGESLVEQGYLYSPQLTDMLEHIVFVKGEDVWLFGLMGCEHHNPESVVLIIRKLNESEENKRNSNTNLT